MIIREMQHKLATWTAHDETRRVNRLLRLITHPDWLAEAARITLSSKGAHTPGVDGITKEHVRNRLNEEIQRIRSELLSGIYEPTPVRRVYIPKANGKQRPLGIPTLYDRIVQRAMLMAMEPIWENDFHKQSYGFRLERSVHHAIRTVKLQLEDCKQQKGRWVIEGDLSSYFDTIHHKLLMKSVRKRISDKRFLGLIWKFLQAGHIDKNLFRASSEGVPQGGVISPLLANIMLHEFDQYLEQHYLSKKARKDRSYWNYRIKIGHSSAIQGKWEWKPAVSYCRYADDFVIIVKGTKAQAEAIREECRVILEDMLHLKLNMEKTKITHVNDGFVFLGHRIIRKRSGKGKMRVVTTIPHEKAHNFSRTIAKMLSTDYSENKIVMVAMLNSKLTGWANFYQYVDFKAIIFSKIDRMVFWKMAYWLKRKYNLRMKPLMKKGWCREPATGKAKTWILRGKDQWGFRRQITLKKLVGRSNTQFRWRTPENNPYLRVETRNTITSRYSDVAMALSRS